MNASHTSDKSVSIWMISGIVLILVIVVIGGMTRLTHSGLSMVHWSFTGSLPPSSEAEWNEEFARYQESPEFIELHRHFQLEDFKSIFWWEYIHRFFARTIGVVFLLPFLWFLYQRKIPRSMLPQFLVILALGASQGLLGWFMVKSGLADVPRVSHFRLSAHLSLAFITCSYILWVLLNYRRFGRARRQPHPAYKVMWFLLLVVLFQVAFGGFVAGLRAGWIHNTWPLMDGDIISPAAYGMQPWWKNILENASGVQFIHRTLGVVLFVWTAWMSLVTYRNDAVIGPALRLTLLAVTLQFALGVATLLLHVPTSLAVIHQVFALVTLLTVVRGVHTARYSR